MGVERVLLQALEFDIMVEHPYKFLSDYVKHLESTHLLQWSQEEVGCCYSLRFFSRKTNFFK